MFEYQLDMYEIVSQELVEPGQDRRFLGVRTACRFCGTRDQSAFGGKKNAHTFPEALGNHTLFSLDECKSCNDEFSVYEDALCKAIGPFLTLGGVKGKRGVRQTGRTNSSSKVRHSVEGGRRRLSVQAEGDFDQIFGINRQTGLLRIRMPIEGDKFIPRHAYKALSKIALALLPSNELTRFKKAFQSLNADDVSDPPRSCEVGFSYSYVGNAPPALAGVLLRRKEAHEQAPYLISIFVAGSVCFQIWVRSDDMDQHVPNTMRLKIKWTSQLPMPEGGHHPIRYTTPIQFDWSGDVPQLQPFAAFDLHFNPHTKAGELVPVPRRPEGA